MELRWGLWDSPKRSISGFIISECHRKKMVREKIFGQFFFFEDFFSDFSDFFEKKIEFFFLRFFQKHEKTTFWDFFKKFFLIFFWDFFKNVVFEKKLSNGTVPSDFRSHSKTFPPDFQWRSKRFRRTSNDILKTFLTDFLIHSKNVSARLSHTN